VTFLSVQPLWISVSLWLTFAERNTTTETQRSTKVAQRRNSD